MPSLRLSEQEALDITAYLIAQKGKAIPQVPGLDETLGDEKAIAHGQWVVRTYGCYGCHNIRGFENEGKLSVELSSFANKQPYELSFGYRVDVPHTWEDWTFAKLRNPRGFHTERQLSKMPNFHLSKEGAEAIRILLKSFTGERVGREWYRDLGPEDLAVEEGRVLLEQYNCKGCHVIDSKGGRILAYYKDPNQGPPQLYGEGARVQPDWLFGFLLGPTKIRQGLDVRMPTFPFSQEKASKIVRYFQGKAGNLDPFINVDVTDLDPNLIVKGKDLFYNMYRCQQCHFLKDRYSDAEKVQVGPNLKLAHEKLRPEWMRQWIANPGKIIPGVRMPTFFYLEEDEHGRPILDPSNEYAAAALPQIEALRAYVLVYGRDKEVLRRIREKQRKKLSMR